MARLCVQQGEGHAVEPVRPVGEGAPALRHKKNHDNPSERAGIQAIAQQPVIGGLAPGQGERVNNQPRGTAGCANRRGAMLYNCEGAPSATLQQCRLQTGATLDKT